ncbi:MAG: MBL fold metallo-hydrolase [Lachnospiraceae bacterium]|nr:MBL fold metallo-hydrolase [Lachnospiraceae bacterium]
MAEVVRINQDTWRVEDGNVRFYLLCGKERAALVDSGRDTPDARQIAEGLTDLPLLLINTHADMDHISGNGAFDEFYMSPAEEENYRSRGGSGTILPVREGDRIDLGGRVLRVIDQPGHTPGSIALLDERDRVLISGDSVQNGRIFLFGRFRNVPLYIESLKHVLEYAGEFDEIYAMHGSVPVGPELIPKLIEGAGRILRGEAEGERVNEFGNEVMLYRFPFAEFLCELTLGK